MAKTRVAVLFGGKSSEHDISLVSAQHIILNIPKDKYEVIRIGITRRGHWMRYIGPDEQISTGEWEKHPDNAPCILSPDPLHKGFIVLGADGGFDNIKADCVFPVLHGKNGEDGSVQGLLQLSGIPFVGSDMISSASCMDKELTHMILEARGVRMAKYISMRYTDLERTDEIIALAEEKLSYPMFVKPCCAGSSVGVSRAVNSEELRHGISLAFSADKKLLIEEGVSGAECECAVMGNDSPFAAGIARISSANEGFYDFESKYENSASETIIPADIPDEYAGKLCETALYCYKAIGCSGLARCDFFLTDDGGIVLNEINTIPGHTPISVYPKLMEHYGLSPSEQEDRLIRYALEREF